MRQQQVRSRLFVDDATQWRVVEPTAIRLPTLPEDVEAPVAGCGRMAGTSLLLAHAAQQAISHAFLMAQPLASYRDRHGLDDATLAQHLGCSVPSLHGLALCQRPRPSTPTYRAEVQALAAYIGCPVAGLRAILEDGMAAGDRQL